MVVRPRWRFGLVEIQSSNQERTGDSASYPWHSAAAGVGIGVARVVAEFARIQPCKRHHDLNSGEFSDNEAGLVCAGWHGYLCLV